MISSKKDHDINRLLSDYFSFPGRAWFSVEQFDPQSEGQAGQENYVIDRSTTQIHGYFLKPVTPRGGLVNRKAFLNFDMVDVPNQSRH